MSATTSIILSSSSSSSDRAQHFASNLPNLPLHHKRLYLLRHGMTDWNKRGIVQGSSYDIPLNDEGRAQARYAAEELSALPITLIVSSHLSRASQTADAVQTFHPSASRLILEGFGEIHYGELEGKCIHDDNDEESKRLKQQFDQVSLDMEKDIAVKYPGRGGESAMQVEQRVRRTLRQMLKDRPNDRHIVVVGHGRSNKILLSSLLYGDASKFYTIEQGNTAISIVDCKLHDDHDHDDDDDDDMWMEILINYCAHNEDRGAASGGRY